MAFTSMFVKAEQDIQTFASSRIFVSIVVLEYIS